ncbi:MAG: hypothetical protein U0835_16065 [Isosphaeraceae bacterium]
MPLPDDFESLEDLPADHLALTYLESRGFDPAEISTWGVGFSIEADWWGSAGRLVVPFRHHDRGPDAPPIGWMTRQLVPSPQALKYSTAKGFTKSHFLYGLDRAEDGKGPVLVCEGVTDVWRAGHDAVALIGKSCSETQLQLLRARFRGRPRVVALDGDARPEAEALANRLKEARRSSLVQVDESPVVVMTLDLSTDPADLSRDELWDLARQSLASGRQA